MRPLADILRPQNTGELAGQSHLLADGMPIARCLAGTPLHSMLLWGPPGCGKTTLAKMLADKSGAKWFSLSAAAGSMREAKAAMEEAKQQTSTGGGAPVLFVDEVHRFNKAQQDAFLPDVESGRVIFIGATTENPSFEINSALLSRLAVYILRPLDDVALAGILRRAADVLGVGFDDDAAAMIIGYADGDGRRLVNAAQNAALAANAEDEKDNNDGKAGKKGKGKTIIRSSAAANAIGEVARRFDKGGDMFYEQISALHKSVRGSDPDASLYWLCRMLDGGCDPLYIARRLTRMASEDIGLAEPGALSLCIAAEQAFRRMGAPEGELALAQAAVYLACAPKSNAVYAAFGKMRRYVKGDKSREVPPHLCNAPTTLAKQTGKGKHYRYAHDEEGGYAAGEDYFPEGITPLRFYQPTGRGIEAKIKQKLHILRQRDADYKAKQKNKQ